LGYISTMTVPCQGEEGLGDAEQAGDRPAQGEMGEVGKDEAQQGLQLWGGEVSDQLLDDLAGLGAGHEGEGLAPHHEGGQNRHSAQNCPC
jgi:hypothetical protein